MPSFVGGIDLGELQGYAVARTPAQMNRVRLFTPW
jgi:hypothetical protein